MICVRPAALSSQPELCVPEGKGKRSGEPALSEVEGDLLFFWFAKSFPPPETPSTALGAGSSLRLKTDYAQTDAAV